MLQTYHMSKCNRSLWTSSISLKKQKTKQEKLWLLILFMTNVDKKQISPTFAGMPAGSTGHVTNSFSVKTKLNKIPNMTHIILWCAVAFENVRSLSHTHNTKCSSHTGFRVSGLTSVTWIHLAGNTSLVLERFSSFSLLFLKLNFLSFFSSVSRGLCPTRIPSMQ